MHPNSKLIARTVILGCISRRSCSLVLLFHGPQTRLGPTLFGIWRPLPLHPRRLPEICLGAAYRVQHRSHVSAVGRRRQDLDCYHSGRHSWYFQRREGEDPDSRARRPPEESAARLGSAAGRGRRSSGTSPRRRARSLRSVPAPPGRRRGRSAVLPRARPTKISRPDTRDRDRHHVVAEEPPLHGPVRRRCVSGAMPLPTPRLLT